MLCKKCENTAVYEWPTLCKEHFYNYIEERVFKTIKRYELIKPNERVVVAASGGKDSLTLLHILSKKFGVQCIAIDEGIKNYRENTLKTLKEFCKKREIKLNIFSYKEEFGGELSHFLKDNTKPCSICGTFRRYLLNKYSKEYDKLCTGHNMDDEAQSILMNLIRPNLELLARIGPKTGIISNNSFVQRVKPLYFLKEREIATYAFLNGLYRGYDECPYAIESYRAKIRDMLNECELKHSGTKENIIKFFLRIQPKLKESIKITSLNYCKSCGEPAKGDVCGVCGIIIMNNSLHQ